MTHPDQLGVGDSPLVHMMLLARAPERVLALRLAMSSVIGPSSVVLDAGCGSLGVLAILAARLGARRVVAVDRGQLDCARALAEENGVADRIEFLECNLADLPAGTGRYTVAGYDSAGADPTERTWQDSWGSAVGQAEALTGITMAAIRRFPGTDYSAFMEQLSLPPDPSAARVRRALAGPDRTLLTSRELFTEIGYADPATAAAYPAALSLSVTTPGRLDSTIWRQELMFGDLLIRRTETTHPLTPPSDVQPGDTAILSTDGVQGAPAVPGMPRLLRALPGRAAPDAQVPARQLWRRRPRPGHHQIRLGSGRDQGPMGRLQAGRGRPGACRRGGRGWARLPVVG
jgi:Ribosomal protein L11 methyltransferase (PrmA)